MAFIIKISFVLLLTSVPQLSFSDDKMINELVDISGIEKQTLAMREILNQQFKARESSDKLSKEQFDKLKSIIMDSFDEKEILRNTKSGLLEVPFRGRNQRGY